MSDANSSQTSAFPENGFSELLPPQLYQELRQLAARRMGDQMQDQTLRPTALVHEAWIRLSKVDQQWRDRGHFFAVVSTVMRNIVIDNARRKLRLRRGGEWHRDESGTLSDLPAADPNENILLMDQGIAELEKVHPIQAQVVVAKFFGGLTNQEVAESFGMGERSVERQWALAKVWLFRWIQTAK